MNRIIRLPEVKRMTGLSRSTLLAAGKSGHFPKSFKISKYAVGWMLCEVEDWIKKVSLRGEEDE